MKPISFLILSFALLTIIRSVDARPRVFGSPDHALRVNLTSNKSEEARIVIRSSNGKLLLDRNFFSQDVQHGRAFTRAAWTSNSQFFVFSTTSSGGHSPWRFTTYFWSRRSRKLSCLDDYIGAVTSAKFVLKKSGEVEGEFISAKLGNFEKLQKK